MRDVYQEITDRIVCALEQGKAPWLKPWSMAKAGRKVMRDDLPHNAVSGRAYNGINLLVLWCSGYQSNAWLTFKQAKELGGNVRKGEKGTLIVFWKFDVRIDETTGKPKTVPFARGYTVFNTEQCEGLDETRIKRPEMPVAGQTDMNALASDCGIRVSHGGDQAFYSPTFDVVQMPSADSFVSVDHYQATLGHELTHATGHASRCKRDFSGRFGNEAYAFEELVAEIGSAFLCAHKGVFMDGLRHHADYLHSWLKVLKDDKRAIFTAASKAKEACTWLLTAQGEVVGDADETTDETPEEMKAAA